MSDFSDALKKLKFDKRMLNWNLRQKIITEEEHQKQLATLPDLSHLKAEPLKTDGVGKPKEREITGKIKKQEIKQEIKQGRA